MEKTNGNLVIPWMDKGRVIYYQTRNMSGVGSKYFFPKDTFRPVFNLENIDLSFPYIIIFEGVFDSIFVKNGVAMGGKALTTYQRELIKSRYPNHRIVYALDNDTAGYDKIMKYIKSDPLSLFLSYPDNMIEKDINNHVEAGHLNVFSDTSALEKMIVGSATMKLKMIRKEYGKT